MTRLFSNIQWTPAVIALIAMNLIPIFGVMFFGWNAGTIVFLYWLENVVIGILNVPKIMSCRQDDRGDGKRISFGGGLFLGMFFSVHYGMFCLGHFVFLEQAFKSMPSLPELLKQGPILISLAGLTLSHLISMLVNFYGKREYLTRAANTQMFLPYPRIVVLHIVIIIGGGVAAATGDGFAVLILLVILKTLVDLAAHVTEHRLKDSLINPGVAAPIHQKDA